MQNLIPYLLLVTLSYSLSILACNVATKPKTENTTSTHVALSPQDCIDKVIALDDSLGNVRNHACEKISLAETIRQYAGGMNQLDYQGCPNDFARAFRKHQKAWVDMIPIVENYPELRGEMHVLFKQLETGKHADTFNPQLKAIWETWGEVEAAMKK